MPKVAIAVHGGAGKSSKYLDKHTRETEEGLKEALRKGHEVLLKGKSAVTAVEKAVILLEDNPYFNAGKGSALNIEGKVEMDASIMDGASYKAGAVSIVEQVKNPIVLARLIMTKTKHVLLSSAGAIELAKKYKLELKPHHYFVTAHQRKAYQARYKKGHGTVGAVACDAKGNLAAGTSTGGISYSLPGRVGDSCIIGAGCYANNKTCAVSGTGQGEFLIMNSIAHSISMLMELKKYPLKKACEHVIHIRNNYHGGEIGVIAMDKKGNIQFSFNTELMSRGYINMHGKLFTKIYR